MTTTLVVDGTVVLSEQDLDTLLVVSSNPVYTTFVYRVGIRCSTDNSEMSVLQTERI